MYKNIINTILLFFLVFGFKLPVLNSTYLAGILSFIILIYRKGGLNYFWSLVKNKYNFTILIITFLLAPIAILIAILHATYDFSLAKQVVSQLPVFICALLVFSVIFPSLKSEGELLKLIIIIFFIQSVIIVFAFLSPAFMKFVELLQYPENSMMGIGNRNNNVFRGLSISGDLFFGLSACYGLIYIFYTKYFLDNLKLGIKDIFIGLVLIIGNIFIARTGFVGLIFAFGLLLFYKSTNSKIGKVSKLLLVTLFVIILGWYLIPTQFKTLIVDNVLPYAFEFLYNYFGNNHFETKSTNVLIGMLNIPIGFKTFLFGNGYFTNISGGYYLNTDSGYLRQILFGGIFYLLFMIFYQFKTFSIGNLKKYLNRIEWYNFKIFVLIIFLYFLTLHIKGLTIGFMRMILIISWYYFSFINMKVSKNKFNKNIQ